MTILITEVWDEEGCEIHIYQRLGERARIFNTLNDVSILYEKTGRHLINEKRTNAAKQLKKTLEGKLDIQSYDDWSAVRFKIETFLFGRGITQY